MKILLDHNLDWRISNSFPDHEVSTTLEMTWDTLKNGALLTEAESDSLRKLEELLEEEPHYPFALMLKQLI